MTDQADFEATFRASPDACALVGSDGRVVAVNDTWTSYAPAAASERAGVGADYVDVCRRAARAGAPRAGDAYAALVDVRAGRRRAASVVYPCTEPTGVRWFRSNVFAVGTSGLVATRHVDVTADLTMAAEAATRDLVLAAPRVLTEKAMHLALADVLDGPPPLAALVLTTAGAWRAGDTRTGSARTGVLDRFDVERLDVDLVARLGSDVLAVLVTAAHLPTAMDRAHAVMDAVSPRGSSLVVEWGIAVRTPRDSATTLMERARQTLRRVQPVSASFDDIADRAHKLHRAADALVTAVEEFDYALAAGAPMARLVDLDRAVLHAERACVTAAIEHRNS